MLKFEIAAPCIQYERQYTAGSLAHNTFLTAFSGFKERNQLSNFRRLSSFLSMETDILLVDDDPVIRSLLGDYLKSQGYSIQEANGGVECLLKLRDSLPEVLVLDMQMPDMSGLEVLKTLNKGNQVRIPVILLSANSDIRELAEKEGVRADVYLMKPFDMQDVKKAVNFCKSKLI